MSEQDLNKTEEVKTEPVIPNNILGLNEDLHEDEVEEEEEEELPSGKTPQEESKEKDLYCRSIGEACVVPSEILGREEGETEQLDSTDIVSLRAAIRIDLVQATKKNILAQQIL